MKILICSLPSAIGGMERRIEAETRLLTTLGHEVLVSTKDFLALNEWKVDLANAGGHYYEWRPYKFIERQHFAAPFRWLALTTLPALKRQEIDFAHIAMPWNFVGLTMAYVLSKTGIPFVFSIHSKFGHKTLSKKEQALITQALSGLVGGYTVSDPVKAAFKHLYDGTLPPYAAIETIHNGIDVTRFNPNPAIRENLRRQLGIVEDAFVLLFCGRLDSNKRPLFALKIFAEFVANHPQGRFLVVGDGPEIATLKTRIDALKLQDKVLLIGQVTDTAPYYIASDCYLSTSALEGYSLTTAEALASGIPAIVPDDEVFTSVYGAASAVQRCAAANPAEWSQALLSIAALDSTARQALSQAARAFAKEHLATEVMNQKLTLFYENIFSRLGDSRHDRIEFTLP
jgi:glycosyltransferase involved in cell wall biosynthesis